jgi:spore germination protein KB
MSFIFGSSIIVGINNDAKQDSWISLLLAIVMVLPLIVMYARIIKLNPNQTLFDILENLFGKIIGKIMIVLMTWYTIHLGTMVLCNFTNFIQLSSLPETPSLIVAFILLFITIYISRSSITTLGKWSSVVLTLILFVVFITILISTTVMHFDHITPIMNHDFKVILGGAFGDFAYPFAETVLFLCLGCFIRKSDSPYKIYIYGILFGGFVLFLVFLRNLAVLGANTMDAFYFPSFVTARVLQLGDFFTRIEGVIMVNFILAGITKITVCLIVASKGIAKIINVNNYKDLIVPTSLLFLALCSILYKSVFEMFSFISVYAIYAIPFQVIIPLIVWIASEIKNKRNKSKTKPQNA